MKDDSLSLYACRVIIPAMLIGLITFSLSEAKAQDKKDDSEAKAQDENDERKTFQTSFYTGISINRFAADDLKRYINPEASNEQQEALVGGFDFAYRLTGSHQSACQLWIYGETK